MAETCTSAVAMASGVTPGSAIANAAKSFGGSVPITRASYGDAPTHTSTRPVPTSANV